jgi:uroporphyrinogen decarboxylase
MNSLERILAALQNQPADRPAFFLNSSLYGARLTGASLDDHYTQAAVYAEGQIAIRETFSPDLLTSPFFVPAIGEAFGSLWRARPNQAPNVVQFAAQSAEEMLKLPLPDVNSHPRLIYLREAIQILAKHFAGQVPTFGVLVSPSDIPPLVIGLDAWLDALLFQPEVAQALLDRLSRFFVDLGSAMLSDGATGLALTANLANAFIVTDQVAETLTIPTLRRSLAELQGPLILHHGGCPLLDQLDRFKGLPNVVAYVLDAGEDLGAARRALGPGPIVMGNLDGPNLVNLLPDEVQVQCDRALAQRDGDHQFILSTSNADIQFNTPPECLEVITEAACRAGGVQA